MFNTSDLFDLTNDQYPFEIERSKSDFNDYRRGVIINESTNAYFYFDDGSVKIEVGCMDVVLSAEEMKKLIYEYQHFPSTSEIAHLYCANLS